MTSTLIDNSYVGPHQEDSQRTELWRLLLLFAMAPEEDKDVMRDTRIALLGMIQRTKGENQFEMSVAEFVERKFIPEHVALKGVSGRIHYQAILRHVLTPDEVDTAFGVRPKGSRKLIEPVVGWPYLSNLRLCDVRPEDVRRLTSAALAHGYSLQTVRHLRNVVSAIFSHAKRELCFLEDNPASLVTLPEPVQAHQLTEGQVNEALRAMNYPEKEMAICAALTGMSPSEISGLQWGHVNLNDAEIVVDGVPVPPRTIAVTQQWCHGALANVKESRVRDLPIPQPLFQLLSRLKSRPRFTGPADFVFVSGMGAPVNQKYLVAHRLRPIAKRMGVPSLSLQALRRSSKSVVSAAWASVA